MWPPRGKKPSRRARKAFGSLLRILTCNNLFAPEVLFTCYFLLIYFSSLHSFKVQSSFHHAPQHTDAPRPPARLRRCEKQHAQLSQIMFMIANITSNETYTDVMFQTWGHNLAAAGSLEIHSLRNDVDAYNQPRELPSMYTDVMAIQWHTDTILLNAMIESCIDRHPERDWFVFAEPTTLVVVDVLRRALGSLNPRHPLHISTAFNKTSLHKSNIFHIFSRAAIHQLLPVVKKASNQKLPVTLEQIMHTVKTTTDISSLRPLFFGSGAEERARTFPDSRHKPFAVLQNMHDLDVFVKVGAAVDSFLPQTHTYVCVY
jgi:hypothetical protein